MKILLKVLIIFALISLICAGMIQFFTPLDSPIRVIWIPVFLASMLCCGLLGSAWQEMEDEEKVQRKKLASKKAKT
jgi:peptidoglycan/LPS O-acetylase OafA/YrhL